MKNTAVRKIISIIILLFIFGCAHQQKIIYPTVSHYIGSTSFMKYKRMAVLPFSDAPNSPQSGQIVQGLANQVFAKFGFDMIERNRLYEVLNEQRLSLTGIIDSSEQIRVGKLLGVKCIVVGEVGQYSTMQRHTDTTYFPLVLYGQTSYVPIQGKQWMESYVSVSLRVIDVESGQLIFSGSGQYSRGLTNPPQQLAEYILGDIIAKWLTSPSACGFRFKGDTYKTGIIKQIIKNLPAYRSGLKVGDKILKINGKELRCLLPLEFYTLMWTYPGEKIVFDVIRNGKFLTFQVVTEERVKVFPLRGK